MSEIGADALQTIEGMESLYDSCKGIAYGLAFQIVREQTAAEDVVQDAFLAVWRGRRQYDPEKGALKSWLLTIVRHRAIDRLRRDRAGSTKVVELEMAELVGDDGADPADMGAERLWLHMALKALPDRQRDAVLLAFFGGYTCAQIAERQGLPLGTVKGQLRLGLQKLAAMDHAPSSKIRR
ncbi:MAG TPA: sigma-70 family RNA polymerase sigma factor [Candidatus Dormibacteraeota bacterium]|nr:sigma-70 family RNA polymerase sigma factor [Candidatus Dormibacteraeota bacterium]